MLVGATTLTGACTTTLTDSTGPESAGLSTAPNSSPAAAVLDDIGSFLIAAGCARTTVSDTGLIVLGFTSAAGERFDCAGVDPVARHAAYRSEVLANAARQALESGMAVALSGYYEWNVIDVQSVCTVYWGTFSITFPNSGEVDAFSPVDGVYVGTYYVEAGVPLRLDFYQDTPCTETMVSRGTFVPFDGGDGSGGDGGCCGGGPGGDAPPSSPPPPPPPPPVPDSVQFAGLDWLSDDLPADPPVCTPTSELDRRIHAWCHGTVPDSGQFQRITDAIASIRARGGQCIPFADVLEAILPDLRLFVQANYPPVNGRQFSGVSLPGAGAQGWMALSLDWVDKYGSFRSPLRISVGGYNLRFSLEDALAHEADHLLGAETHEGPPGGGELIFTPLQQQCSPFGTQWP